MFDMINRHLSIKMLIVLVVILVGSFSALCLSILAKQGSLLGGMQANVYEKLQQNGENAQGQFKTLEGHVKSAITDMGEQSARNLAAMTADALTTQKNQIEKDMEKMLENNAAAVADLLSSVGKDDLMAKNDAKLLELSRAVAKTEEIIFAFFFDKDNNLLPGYVDLMDNRVDGYLKGHEDDVEKAARLLEAAKSDTAVFLYEKAIDYYNLPIGKVVLCISKDSVSMQLAALTSSFATLNSNNAKSIRSVIAEESVKVAALMQKDFSGIEESNTRAIAETGDILKDSARQVNSGTTWVVAVVGTLCCLGVLAAVAVMLRLMVIGPIQRITTGLRDTAEGEGDLTKRLIMNRNDEIGELAGWFNTFIAKLNTIIVDIGANSETVASSSFEVLSVAEHMLEESESLLNKANAVAAASEEMNVSMSSVAAASEEASTNIGIVASAAGEMKGSLDDVVLECRKAKDVSNTAMDQVKNATGKVGLLGEAAREISKVSQVITEIADQTNLLALNATIEAARAGEAGKGFAVVAGEIKNLAQQTRGATQEIKAKIEGIQNSTEDTVEEVGLISGVIKNVDAIMTAIAQSITVESERAAEVARNIEQASQGIAEVNENVAQSSQVSAQIAGEMTEVSRVAGEMSTRSDQMRTSSGGLTDLSSQLKGMISVFKVSIDEADQRGGGAKRSTSTGPELFPWNEKLVLGFAKIDDQHKELVRLINQLHNAMRSKVGAREAGRILDELAKYTTYHFGFEEELFDRYGYPAASEHKKIHRDLVAKVVGFQQDFHQGRAGLSMDLMNFLTDWLKQHILQTDRAYAPFFHDKNI